MIARVRRRRADDRGAILVLFAIATPILIGMLAIALDLGYGFVQTRRAQNAADFAAYAAAQQLNGSTVCNGATAAPNMQQVVDIVQHVVSDNAPSIGSAWTGQFIDDTGKPIKNSNFVSTSGNAANYPPPGACGVSVNATPAWKPFFASILGVDSLSGTGSSIVSNSIQGQPIGIVALNKVGPHETLGGGSGQFVVSGDMVLNTDVENQPWSVSSHGWEFDDAVDAKTGSNLYVFGTIHTNDGTYNKEQLWPLDQCFSGQGAVGEGNGGGPAYGTASTPTNTLQCTSNGSKVTVGYNAIDPTVAAINDPLQSAGSPPSPFNTSIACPGMNAVTYSSSPSSGTLLPGEYTSPVLITGSAVFDDCSGYAGEAAYPGVYRFDKGLWIDPQTAGETVTGSNVLLGTNTPYPIAGNVPGSTSKGVFTASGSGNGAPCLPKGTMTSAPSGDGSPEPEVDGTAGSACGGTSPTTYGVIAYGDTSFKQVTGLYGTGDNLSAIIGGVAGTNVSLSGPTTGQYAGSDGAAGVVLYQNPSTQANYGFDAQTGNAATVNVTGVVYNASLTSYGSSAPQDYWDGTGGGIPFYAGGTLQAGYGAGWSDGPAASTGAVTINGTCIVDDFNTDGGTTITIFGQPFSLPGAGRLSFIG